MPTYHIHLEGQVQGVGFRPYVYRAATRLGLTGWVANGADGLHVCIQGFETACRVFIDEITQRPPEHARVKRQELSLDDSPVLSKFEIRESSDTETPNLLLTPDLALCDECRAELFDTNSRRFHYAFNTCTNCGPRYAITQQLPFDRDNTTMASFQQCPHCAQEYGDANSRRFYSQTNSCPHCGMQIRLLSKHGEEINTTDGWDAIEHTVALLKEGQIVAAKGIGGYLLLADACDRNAVQKLRDRKHRPGKPLAVLFPDLASIQQVLEVNEQEEQALRSKEAPIVLLTKKHEASALATDLIAPGLQKIGAMLPYSPLLACLAHEMNSPLIATSGNISGSPIFFNDEDALANLGAIADYFLTNNRDIVIPQDDSVLQFTNRRDRLLLRRSRGFAPTYFPHPFQEENKSIWASGADMKSTVSLLAHGNLYVSQYIGDLENFETQQSYQLVTDHFLKLFRVKPNRVLIDAHPAYFSSKLGRELAATWEVPLKTVQHHMAHFAAVLAENNLMRASQPVLGVVWDGTGWGLDGEIWGGEFFKFQFGQFGRVEHLPYFDHLLGDKISREPRLSALALCARIGAADEILKNKFSEEEWKLYKSMLSSPHNLKTSSVGRLFDAVAALLQVCDRSTYEGEAAMKLEALARKGTALFKPHSFSLDTYLRSLIENIRAGADHSELALGFHHALVNWIDDVAQRQQIGAIAFSGGVFQNGLLMELVREHLGNRYQLYFHQQLSPNDECISFGQLAYDEITSMQPAEAKSKRPTAITNA